MRIKVKLKVGTINIEDAVVETSKFLNKLLGENNKWHDLDNKPYSCSFLLGASKENRKLTFKDGGHIFINTNDEEVINAIMSNNNIEFGIENLKVFKDYNILSAKRIKYKTQGKLEWVNESTKDKFIECVKNKYCVDIEILKIYNTTVHYKGGSKIPVSDLLIKVKGENNVANLFETGIGFSCSLGFGFVEPYKKA